VSPARRAPRPTEKVVDGHRIVFDEETSTRMGGIRQEGTKPELIVRRALAAQGLRYRTSNRDLPGSPDLANRTGRWAVFVHGCYWHRHRGCRRATTPKRNTDFWVAKFEANVARDARATSALEELGYRVLTVWECEAESPTVLDLVEDFVRVLRHEGAPPSRSAKERRRSRSTSRSQSRSS
jgi:DNA mismatch endonuclease (patch repair protein)